MFEQAQMQHAWLERLVGEWKVESECRMGPDKPPQITTARITCRMVGKLWLLLETVGDPSPDGDWSTIMTLGFDARQQCYVGTFIGSMMTHLWQYRGVLDAAGKVLPLDSEGPKFDGSGTTRYRDTVEIVDSDCWLFYGDVLSDDGSWNRLMSSTNRRI